MINSIKNIALINNNTIEKNEDNTVESGSFMDLLKESIYNTNNTAIEANKITEAFALGKIEDIHQVTIATEKAGLAMNLTLAVQNKAVEAYKEIMRIQV